MVTQKGIAECINWLPFFFGFDNVMNILLRLEELSKQDLPVLLGVDGNNERVMKNKEKAVELVSNMAALLQLVC